MLLHISELRGCPGIVSVPEHSTEEVCEESAGATEDIEGIQVLGDALLDVSDGSGVGHGVVAAARSREAAQGGSGGCRCHGRAQGPA